MPAAVLMLHVANLSTLVSEPIRLHFVDRWKRTAEAYFSPCAESESQVACSMIWWHGPLRRTWNATAFLCPAWSGRRGARRAAPNRPPSGIVQGAAPLRARALVCAFLPSLKRLRQSCKRHIVFPIHQHTNATTTAAAAAAAAAAAPLAGSIQHIETYMLTVYYVSALALGLALGCLVAIIHQRLQVE